MNGAHDLGGMHGFGRVLAEADEPVFHAEWERRIFALTVAAGFLGRWNIDMSRHARERMDPAEYLATSYYEHWLHGLELLVAETKLADESAASLPVLRPGEIDRRLGTGNPFRVNEDVPPRFKAGDEVVARNDHPLGHTRLPRYARGHRGRIDRDHGVFVFADANAHGLGKKPQHCYSVRFAARELWGPQASAIDCVHVDLWDDHLIPA